MIGIYAGTIAAVLAIPAAWVQLDMPLPATHDEIETVQQYAESTRSIVLNDKWIAAEAKLRRAEEQYAKNPTDNLRSLINHLRATLRDLDTAIAKLK